MKFVYPLNNGTADTHEIDFNKEWAKTKTEAEFVDEFKDQDHIMPDADDKIARLKEAYQKLTGNKPKEAPVQTKKEAPVQTKKEAPVQNSGSTPVSTVTSKEAPAGK